MTAVSDAGGSLHSIRSGRLLPDATRWTVGRLPSPDKSCIGLYRGDLRARWGTCVARTDSSLMCPHIDRSPMPRFLLWDRFRQYSDGD